MNAALSPAGRANPASAPQKCITFAVGSRTCSLELARVREIIGYLEITPIPSRPAHVAGVIRFRGLTLAVVDLRSRLDQPVTETTDDTCILVVETHGRGANALIGAIVDRVISVDPINGQIRARLLNVDSLLGAIQLKPAEQMQQAA